MTRAWLRWGGLFALGVLAVALFAGLRVPQNINALREKHHRIRELQIQNADLKKEIEDRRRRLRELEESRERQELEARKQRMMMREGETRIITPEEPSVPAPH